MRRQVASTATTTNDREKDPFVRWIATGFSSSVDIQQKPTCILHESTNFFYSLGLPRRSLRTTPPASCCIGESTAVADWWWRLKPLAQLKARPPNLNWARKRPHKAISSAKSSLASDRQSSTKSGSSVLIPDPVGLEWPTKLRQHQPAGSIKYRPKQSGFQKKICPCTTKVCSFEIRYNNA